MRRVLWGLTAALVVLGAAASVAVYALRARNSVPAQHATLCLAWPIGLLPALAVADGSFKEEGLDLTVRPYNIGRQAFDGLLAGHCDFATVAEQPVAVEAVKSSAFRIVAVHTTKENHGRIVVRPGSGITRPAELRGKRLSVLGGTTGHFFAYRVLLDQGIGEDAVQLVLRGAVAELRADLLGERADAASVWQPYASRLAAELGPGALALEVPDLVINRMMIVSTVQVLRERPEAARALLRGLRRAQQAANDRDAAAARIAQAAGTDAEEVKANWTPDTRMRVTLPQALLLELEEMARWARAKGLAEGVAPNFLDYVYLDALAEVAPEAVTVLR
jgi:NitT/TauT family transport system substrate-binding protein